jgi:phosphoglycerol transferase MdoB-like AlkP superfamily enzyme
MLTSTGLGSYLSVFAEPVGAILAVVSAIILLAIAVVIFESKFWEERVASTFDSGISSLFLVFCAIVLFEILKLLR